MINLIVIFFGVSTLLIISEFISCIIKKERWLNKFVFRAIEIVAVIIGPALFLILFDFNTKNDCCSESAFFSPEHRSSVYVLIAGCVYFYFYASYKEKIGPPLVEVFSNCFLIIGIIMNILIAVHINETPILWVLGNMPAILIFFIALLKRHQLFLNNIGELRKPGKTFAGKIAWRILSYNVFLKYPLLLIICLPVLILVSGLLLTLGQKPDSMIKAFTDTYKHGFSEWDYMCDNVQCGGHYLCSVATNGHKNIVRPERLGFRNRQMIICNRQLLIANAFEELIEQKLPAIHRIIRENYDRIGDCVHKYYGVFNNKFVSDVVYIAMKPAEWFFLIILYMCYNKPENRIAQQYLKSEERCLIDRKT